jgi:hypothetical protein
MRESPELTDYLASLESNPVRLEAMSLFERCLSEGAANPFEAFVEEQLSHDPPEIELLRDVAEDLHQRLLSLREHHFDVRDQALRRLQDDYLIDLSPLTPPDALDRYHLLDAEEAVAYLRGQYPIADDSEALRLRRLLEASTAMATQLYHDVLMTEHLYDFVTDWVMGLCALVARQGWEPIPASPRTDSWIQ